MLWLAVLVVLGLIAFCTLVLGVKPKQFPPGPTWLPVVGCFSQFSRLYSRLGYYHLVWDELYRIYGPLVGLKLGRDRLVIVSGLHAIKHVSSRADCEGRPDGFFYRMRSFEQRLGVVFTDGQIWQEQRRFSSRHLRSLGLAPGVIDHIISQEVEDLIVTMRRSCENSSQGSEMDLHSLCNVSVLNALWAVVAGQRFELTDSRLLAIFKLQHDSFRQLDMSGGIINQMPFIRFVAPERSGYNTLIQTVNANYDFLRETLIEHQKTIIFGKPQLQLMTLCFDLFMAGSETTNVTLGFLLLLMLHYPEVQTRVQDELDHVVGTHRLPLLSDRPNLPYVEAVIMETLRFINPAPVADTILLMSIWSVHMDREHWGDPEIFRPERFLDATGQNLIKYECFIPFGIGKRRCLGEALAKNNLFLFFAALLQNFKFLTTPGEEPPTLIPFDGVTLSPQPFKGIVQPR
ncbi:hypothetical protein B566_EDAN003790, partial [Ephemera danica]